MAILIDFDFVSRDAADAVNAAGTVTFYDTGTTTLKTVYSDAGLTTPLANPYTLDSAGRFSGPVYAPDGERYAILESTSGAATIRTRDPVWGTVEDPVTSAPSYTNPDMSTITLTAGSGLSYSAGGTNLASSATIDLDVNELTAETTVAATDDFLVMYDTSATAHRKVLADAFLGTDLGDGKWYKTSGTTGVSTESTLVCDTAEYDQLTRGTFSTTTGEYTVGSEGARVLVIAQQRLQSQDVGSDAYITIQKNGANAAYGITTVFSGFGASTQTSMCTTTITCVSGDVIRARSYCDTDETYGTGTANTFVSIVELG